MIQYDLIFFLILTIIYPSILARRQDFGRKTRRLSLGGRQNGNDSNCTWYSILNQLDIDSYSSTRGFMSPGNPMLAKSFFFLV